MIPFFDLKRQHDALQKEMQNAIESVFASSHFILGEEVKAFEKEFSDYIGCKYGIGVASGTEALFLSLKALDIGSGDEVVTVPNTAIATAEAIKMTGAMPVFVDIDSESYTMSSEKLEGTITNKTKAIIPVHLYGQACDLDPIMGTAEKHSIPVVEDCAQSTGASYKDKKTGSFGNLSCFSFYPTKNLGGCGDGGAILTNDEKLAEKLMLLRNYGEESKFKSTIHGYNSRLDELQAALLRVKLKHLDAFNAKRRSLASYYNENLKNLSLPKGMDYGEHVYHLYVVRSQKRDALLNYLKEQDIGYQIHYPIPIHLQKSYSDLSLGQGSFPEAERHAKEIVSLPLFPELTEEEIEIVCNKINTFT